MRTIRQPDNSSCIDEFIFNVNETIPEFIVESFTNWLADYIGNGAEFRDGQTLQYGYAILSCQVQSRVLRLLAPDFQSMPVQWIDNLGPVFRIVAAHKYTPETFGFVPDIPALTNTVIVGKHFDEIPMFANRQSPVESDSNDSGWFIGSSGDDIDNNDADQLRRMSLYEAMLAVPHMLDFLSLPVGCQVVFSGGTPVILKDYEELEIPPGSYLDLMSKAQG